LSAGESTPSKRRGASLPRRVGREVKIHGQAARALRSARRATRGGTVVVGPWCSEVGFEVLYWIPFVRRLLREAEVTPDRVVVVSRGGVSSWYGEMTSRYIDLLGWLSTDDLMEERMRRIKLGGGEKQMTVTPFDRSALERVCEQLGERDVRILHPSTMYRRYRAVWLRRRSPRVVEHELNFSPINPGPGSAAGLIEGEYIAVKAYFSSCFPDTPANRATLVDLLERLAQRAQVVLLENAGGDDHEHDWQPEVDGVIPFRASSPASNLAEQTQVVRGAQMLAATYGGFSYLGPFLGIPTCAFYSHGVFNRAHLDVLRIAEQALAKWAETGAGYVALDTRHLALIDQLARQPAGYTARS
jgi:hypothetical protein